MPGLPTITMSSSRALYAVDAFIRERTGRTTLGKACVDTAPLLERDFAEQAGLGFIGRNTCLITPGLGSWTFLAAVGGTGKAGRRTKDEGRKPIGHWSFVFRRDMWSLHPLSGRLPGRRFVAPTATPVGPHILDARRCISYLTIELRGPIPVELRPLMGNWVFGCDVCQEVCPYNRATGGDMERGRGPCQPGSTAAAGVAGAGRGRIPHALPRHSSLAGKAARLGAQCVPVAAGNWGDPAAIPALSHLLADVEPLIRGHAAWGAGPNWRGRWRLARFRRHWAGERCVG